MGAIDEQRARLLDDPVEYVLEDGRRFAWSESNVRYEEVPIDGASFTLLRKRLSETRSALAESVRAMGDALTWVPPKHRDQFFADHIERTRMVHDLLSDGPDLLKEPAALSGNPETESER